MNRTTTPSRQMVPFAALFSILFLGTSAWAIQDTAQPGTWATDGTVDTIQQSGNTVYVGGLFSKVGPFFGGGGSFATDTGIADSTFPKFGGMVTCAISDGAGGYYVGGSFGTVNNTPKTAYLVHIKADKSVDTVFNPNVDGSITCLALGGGTLYLAGYFTNVGGKFRRYFTSVDAVTGAVNTLSHIPDIQPFDTMLLSGTTLYCGGRFTYIDATNRLSVCAFDTTTGNLTSFDPQTNFGGEVFSLALSGTTLFIAGNFVSINSSTTALPRTGICAVDTTTGTATSFNADTNNRTVFSIVLSGNTLYAGGLFQVVNAMTSLQPRTGLAAFDITTGLATSFAPVATGQIAVYSIALSGSTLYATGNFTAVNNPFPGGPSLTRGRGAAFDIVTGNPTAFDPDLGASGRVILINGNSAFIGGDFAFIKGTTRRNLAAFDANTGLPTAFDPNCNNEVLRVLVSGNSVFAGGRFSQVNGNISRFRLAEFNATTGTVTTFFPNPGASVYTLALSGTTLYFGGDAGCGAFNTTDSSPVAAFNPFFSSAVLDIALSGTTLYCGGKFIAVNGMQRNHIAAVNTADGTVTPFDPNVTSTFNTPNVWSLLVSGSTVYAGGEFDTVNTNVARNKVAAFDATTGTVVSAFNANVADDPIYKVSALAISGTNLYLGGTFTNVGPMFRLGFATVDATSGALGTYNPDIGGNVGSVTVNALHLSSTALYAGGAFVGGAANDYHPNFAAFSLNDPTITALNPANIAVSGPAFTLTVNGTNFLSRSVVNWNGTARPTTAVNVTTLTAAIPATDIAALGTAQVNVVTTGNPATASLPIVIGNAPAITSPLAVNATAGAAFTYTLTATGDAPVTLNATGLPTGFSFTTPTLSGRSTTVTQLTATLTASNIFGVDTKTLTMNFMAPVLSGTDVSTADTDGDGFTDELEAFFGTNPLDPASSPVGNVAAVTAALTSKLNFKLDFAKPNNDSLSFSGVLPIPTGFNISGQKATVNIGGIIRTYFPAETLSLFKLGKPKSGLAKFTLTLKKDSVQSFLADEGFINADIKKGEVPITVQVLFNGTLYSQKLTLGYNAKPGKSGTAK